MTPLQPLTERILARLPGRRVLWIGAWALGPWLNAGANFVLGTTTAVWEQSPTLALLNYAALSVAIVIALWGAERIAPRLEGLRATTSIELEGYSTERFRELNSVMGPLLASAATSVVFRRGRVCQRRLDIRDPQRSDMGRPRDRALDVPVNVWRA